MARLSVVTIALLGALSIVDLSRAEIPPDKVPVPLSANHKLLNSIIVQEGGKAGSAWNLSNPRNQVFYNVRNILRRQELMSLENTINARVYEIRRRRRSVDSSA